MIGHIRPTPPNKPLEPTAEKRLRLSGKIVMPIR
jgi:hypothetical protein